MLKQNMKKLLLIVIAILLIITACTENNHNSSSSVNNDEDQQIVPPTNDKEESENNEEDIVSSDNQDTQQPVDLKSLKVNELGKIMVLMYHDIGEEEDIWVRTPENLRKDLKTLYEKGYRAIGMKDFIEGNIDTPPGTTPVVITFDDGTKGQFNVLGEDGEFVIDPDSAVGILDEFNRQYPEFGLKATFYVNYPTPFRQKEWVERKFEYLVENGMEIGNHCYNHENLRMDLDTKETRDAQSIQEAIGKHVKSTQEIIPNYQVDSLALPYGAGPKDAELYNYVVQGSFEGTSYHNKAILLVGSNPARPSYHKDTNMARVPRIRASEMDTENTGLYDWLEYLDKNPGERYISDGDPNTISFPKELEDQLDKNRTGDKTIQPYE